MLIFSGLVHHGNGLQYCNFMHFKAVPVKKWFVALFFVIVCPLGIQQKHQYYQILASQEAQLRPVL